MRRVRGRARCRSLALALLWAPVAWGQTALVPLGRPGEAPTPPWHFAGLPDPAKPATEFSLTMIDGAPALRVSADRSYGNLVHPLASVPAGTLSWRWRLDLPNPTSDLRRRSGDDVALKVCAMFALPDTAVPFVERQLLRMARLASPEPLPAATLCYVWDAHLAAGTVLDNAFSRRLRLIVLRGPEAPLKTWQAERRDLAQDFLRLFGDEATQVPPLTGIAVGADADNAKGRSLGYLADLALP